MDKERSVFVTLPKNMLEDYYFVREKSAEKYGNPLTNTQIFCYAVTTLKKEFENPARKRLEDEKHA